MKKNCWSQWSNQLYSRLFSQVQTKGTKSMQPAVQLVLHPVREEALLGLF
jgi:hypothetical protein